MKLKIEEHHIITLTYELREGSAEGELLERMDARYPFIFLFGTGKLLKSFEDNLYGLGVEIGNMVNLTDDEGLSHNGKILAINESTIRVDFNHAMVDKDLHFKGAVLNIRKATMEELIQKHYIKEDGVRR